MARSLLDISDDMLALDDVLDERGGDVTGCEQIVDAWFSELGAERERKLDGYAAFIRELEARATARMKEAERLIARHDVDMRKADFLRARLKAFFEVHKLTKVECERATISLVNNGGKAPLLIDERAPVPPEFQRCIPERWEPNKDAIRAALESGNSLTFARLGERGKQLRIR